VWNSFMKTLTEVLLILVLASAAMGAELPSLPHSIEHDPGMWALQPNGGYLLVKTLKRDWHRRK
jgi:hypothetical protein